VEQEILRQLVRLKEIQVEQELRHQVQVQVVVVE
jgi:hypothetical protein